MNAADFQRASKYADTLGNDSKRRYARAYIAYRASAIDVPSEKEFHVSPEAANRIQLSVDAFLDNQGRA